MPVTDRLEAQAAQVMGDNRRWSDTLGTRYRMSRKPQVLLTPRHFQEASSGDGKRTRTYALLLDTAIEVFAKEGVEAASIVEITKAAGLANGSFYYHFPDKAALLEAVGRAISSTLSDHTAVAMEDIRKGADRVFFGVMFFIRHAAANPSWGRLIAQALDERGEFPQLLLTGLRKDVQLGIEQGQLNVTPSPALYAVVLGIVRAALLERLQHPQGGDFEAVAGEAVLRVLGCRPARVRALVAAAIARDDQQTQAAQTASPVRS
ncbi:TetR/AcrR family transcriptional regulator [Hydrogenophaga sp.]|uniref:TetR/AcrR family transcriptional regulator n=1 Tax=Hydrogenophaga sp. TaxID=1904254 RepID=UPI00271FD295|nr:TetR/AcrR family transcriptional regulator [Hydrogenophaga sp.]MDO9603212.1 helix-turn-helix domain-containing protein [Hydrogenophaga sp.]